MRKLPGMEPRWVVSIAKLSLINLIFENWYKYDEYHCRILASASDDLHVMLWDPFRYKELMNIATGHTGNIFSVKVSQYTTYFSSV